MQKGNRTKNDNFSVRECVTDLLFGSNGCFSLKKAVTSCYLLIHTLQRTHSLLLVLSTEQNYNNFYI